MRKAFGLFAAALVFAAAGQAQEKPGEKPQAQLPAFSESAGSEYVLVPVVVLDKKGRFVEGLEKKNFQLRVQGVPVLLEFITSKEVTISVPK